jgi:hypothetical protein
MTHGHCELHRDNVAITNSATRSIADRLSDQDSPGQPASYDHARVRTLKLHARRGARGARFRRDARKGNHNYRHREQTARATGAQESDDPMA